MTTLLCVMGGLAWLVWMGWFVVRSYPRYLAGQDKQRRYNADVRDHLLGEVGRLNRLVHELTREVEQLRRQYEDRHPSGPFRQPSGPGTVVASVERQ